MAPFWLVQNVIRGHVTGVYAPCHTYPLNPGDTFTVASGNLSGKSFIAVNGWTATNETQQRATQAFIEFSDTWAWQFLLSSRLIAHRQVLSLPPLAEQRPRSEERRVGKECVGTCRSRWSQHH